MSAANDRSFQQKAAAWWAGAKVNRYFRLGIAGAVIVALLDQATKAWIVYGLRLPERGHIEISGIFDLSYVENTGASFGLLRGGLSSRIILSLVVVGVVIGLITWLGQLRRPIAAAGVAFIIGGALGNLYDRIAYGYVIDFLNFSGLYFPWVFNVADSAINVGVALLLLDAWRTREQTPAK